MPTRSSLTTITCCLVLALQPAESQDTSKKFKEAVAEFMKKAKEARTAVIAEYNRSIASLRTAPGYTGSARKDKIDAWTKAKQLFEASEKFPGEDEFALLELRYCRALNRAYLPAAKVIDDTLNSALKAGNDKLAEEAQQAKIKFEKELLPSHQFTANSRWHGTLTRSKDTIPYHLNIGKMTQGGTFNGHVEDNAGVAGNWSYDVEGQTVGLGVEFAMTKSTRGKFTSVRVSGIVSGNKLIAEVVSTSSNSGAKPTAGLIVLYRR